MKVKNRDNFLHRVLKALRDQNDYRVRADLFWLGCDLVEGYKDLKKDEVEKRLKKLEDLAVMKRPAPPTEDSKSSPISMAVPGDESDPTHSG
jgi:hypothetical protein